MPKIEIDVTEEEHELWATASRIDELKKELKTLETQRNDLIKKLVEEGGTQTHVARLALVTSARVSQLVTGYYDKD